MKKTLSLILAVIMLLGCMSVTAFAEDNTSVITATVPKMSYTIIIPSETTLTEDAHADILMGGASGKASITVDKHGSAKENVYYTVDLTNANLADADGNTITTSYTYAQGGDYSALTADTKVTVYTGGKVVDSTIKVTADDTEWMAAPSGDYNATVVFNFAKEEVKKVTIADILPDNFPTNFETSSWTNNGNKLFAASGLLYVQAAEGFPVGVETGTELTLNGEKYSFQVSGVTFTFFVNDNKFFKVTISGCTENMEVLNGDYTQAK